MPNQTSSSQLMNRGQTILNNINNYDTFNQNISIKIEQPKYVRRREKSKLSSMKRSGMEKPKLSNSKNSRNVEVSQEEYDLLQKFR